jgi:thiol-disulfide isomerase/thioredoxin
MGQSPRFALTAIALLLLASCGEQGSLEPRPSGAPTGQPETRLTSVTREPTPAPAPNKRLFARSFINRPAPELIVETWLTRQPDLRGKMVLVDFWATYCGPCRKAIPEMNAWHHKFGDRLAIIGLSDETADVVAAMHTPRIEYFSAVDPQGRTKQEFAVQGIPHVVILDPSGIVRWEGFPFLPGHELTEEVLLRLLDTYAR